MVVLRSPSQTVPGKPAFKRATEPQIDALGCLNSSQMGSAHCSANTPLIHSVTLAEHTIEYGKQDYRRVWVGDLTSNVFQDVAFLPSRASLFSPHSQKIVIEVKASGQLHVQKLLLGVSKDMLLVRHLCSNKASLCQFNFEEIIRLSQSWGESGHPQFCGYYQI